MMVGVVLLPLAPGAMPAGTTQRSSHLMVMFHYPAPQIVRQTAEQKQGDERDEKWGAQQIQRGLCGRRES